jgi:glycogen debranching enzyme
MTSDEGLFLEPDRIDEGRALLLRNAATLSEGMLANTAVDACAPLLTSMGLRSLAPGDPVYTGRHPGGPAARDRAYHQGTVWPWLIGSYPEAALDRRAGRGPARGA